MHLATPDRPIREMRGQRVAGAVMRSRLLGASVALILFSVPLRGQSEPRLLGTWVGQAQGVALTIVFSPDGRYVFTLASPQGRQDIPGRYQVGPGGVAFIPDGQFPPGQYRFAFADQDTLQLVDAMGQGTVFKRRSAAADGTGAVDAIPLQPAGTLQPPLPLPAFEGGHIVFTRYVPVRFEAAGQVVDTRLPKLFVINADGSALRPFLAPADATSVMQARWTSDYARLTFASDWRSSASVCMQDIFVVSADGRELRRLTGQELAGPAPLGYGAVTGVITDNTAVDSMGRENPNAALPTSNAAINITAQGADGQVYHPGAPELLNKIDPATRQPVGQRRVYRFTIPRVATGAQVWLKVWTGKYEGNFAMVQVAANQVNDVGEIQLSGATILCGQPNLSADGRHLVCLGSLAGKERNARPDQLAPEGGHAGTLSQIGGIDTITVVDPATGVPTGSFEPLRMQGENANYPALSPDGRTVALAWGRMSLESLTLLSLDSLLGKQPAPQVLVKPEWRPMEIPPQSWGCGTPAWSPDGRLLAFTRSCTTSAVNGQIAVIGADGRDLRQVTRCRQNQLPCWPCFSPDGRSIVFTLLTADGPVLDILNLVAGQGYRSDLYRINLDGTGLQQLTEDGASCEPAWGP